MEDGNKEALARIAKVKANKAQVLNLSGLGLTTIPPEVFELTNLKQLFLDSNKLTDLPQNVGQLTNLKVLSLSGNRLTTLPPELFELSGITGLWLDNNSLTAFPPDLGKLIKAKIGYYNNPLKFDFKIGYFYVTVLTPERALVGCTIFEVNFLLNTDTDELIDLTLKRGVLLDYWEINEVTKQWQTKLINALNARYEKGLKL